jgi:hypothetical protein
MKLAMSVELEDLRFAVKQIVDLKSLTDANIIKFICKRIDITGIVIKGWPQL